jgi:tetratricopeptide (TPR) repeat protein
MLKPLRALSVLTAGVALLIGCLSTPVAEAPSAPGEELSDTSEPEGFSAGVAAISDGDFETAGKIFDRVVSDEPSNAQAHFYLGVARQNLGQSTEAIASYEQALSLNPKLAEAWVNLTAALLDAGKAEQALPVIERGLVNHPGHAGLLYNRALALNGAHKSAEALAAYREALAADPANAEVKYGYAEALVAAGSKDQAVKVLKELAQADNLDVLASTARLLGRLKQFDDCIAALSKALDKQKSSELYVARGLCQHGKQDDAAAFEDFQRAVQKDGSYAPAHYYAGMHLKTQGKKAEARSALTRAVEIAGEEGVGKAAKRALESL